jgi:hypothetical protein
MHTDTHTRIATQGQRGDVSAGGHTLPAPQKAHGTLALLPCLSGVVAYLFWEERLDALDGLPVLIDARAHLCHRSSRHMGHRVASPIPAPSPPSPTPAGVLLLRAHLSDPLRLVPPNSVKYTAYRDHVDYYLCIQTLKPKTGCISTRCHFKGRIARSQVGRHLMRVLQLRHTSCSTRLSTLPS